MKELLCLISTFDKYTREEYEEGKVYEFDDETVLARSNKTRAEEVLSARTTVTNEPYFEEYVEEVTEEVVEAVATAIVEEAEETGKTVEEVVEEIVEETKEEWAVTEEEDGNVHVRPVVDGEIIDTPVEKVLNFDEDKEEIVEEVKELIEEVEEKTKRTRKTKND